MFFVFIAVLTVCGLSASAYGYDGVAVILLAMSAYYVGHYEGRNYEIRRNLGW